MKKNLTSSTRTAGAADQAERAQRTGATPRSGTLPPAGAAAIFTATVRRLREITWDCLKECEISDENFSRAEHCRLALLEIIEASNMPFGEFYERLRMIAPETAERFTDQLDTLDILADVCKESEAAR